jgi:hypothetical protein
MAAPTGLTSIRLRLFPSRVHMPDGTVHDTVLTLVGLDRVWFYTETGHLIGEHMLDDLWGNQQQGYGLLVNGQEIQVKRGGGCGCGSRFRSTSTNPFPVRMTMSPIPKTRRVGV